VNFSESHAPLFSCRKNLANAFYEAHFIEIHFSVYGAPAALAPGDGIPGNA